MSTTFTLSVLALVAGPLLCATPASPVMEAARPGEDSPTFSQVEGAVALASLLLERWESEIPVPPGDQRRASIPRPAGLASPPLGKTDAVADPTAQPPEHTLEGDRRLALQRMGSARRLLACYRQFLLGEAGAQELARSVHLFSVLNQSASGIPPPEDTHPVPPQDKSTLTASRP